MAEKGKLYKVVGTQPVYDTQPGCEFCALLPEWQEKLLIEGGHIAPVRDEHSAQSPKGKES